MTRALFALMTLTTISLAKAPLPLLLTEDFEKGAKRWEPIDPATWKILKTEKGNVYNQFKNASKKTHAKHRSPHNIALLKDIVVGDFIFDAKVQSTKKDYPHRDMRLFFGFQDRAHFYYVHFGKRTDNHANQIFIVNNAPRTKISTKTSKGTHWDDEWHCVRITRDVKSGSIRVFFDDMTKPVMTATDKTFTWGRVGIGSFDENGNWEDIKLYGIKASRK